MRYQQGKNLATFLLIMLIGLSGLGSTHSTGNQIQAQNKFIFDRLGEDETPPRPGKGGSRFAEAYATSSAQKNNPPSAPRKGRGGSRFGKVDVSDSPMINA
ncbi:MAG: hypothetical protein ACFBSC_11655 [Microcoleaceae cyanobacterium]